MSPTPQRCCAFVTIPGHAFFRQRQCKRVATTTGPICQDGTLGPTCPMHSTEAKAARAAKSAERYEKGKPYRQALYLAGLRMKERHKRERKAKTANP